MIPLPAPYLYAWLFLGGLLTGGYGVHTWYKAQRVDAIEEAREEEHELQDYADQAGRDYVAAIEAQRDAAQRNANDFRKVLHEKNRELDACRVDADLLRVLDDAGRMPRPAGDPGEPRPGPARAAAAPDSTCAAELNTCRANYAEVCVPNAIHVRELRDFTRRLIRDYNRAIGRD